MNKIKIGMAILIVSIACGSFGFWWGKTSVPQKSNRYAQSPANKPNDSRAIAMQSQFTLLQEILVSVKSLQEQVRTLNDRQDAFGQQIDTMKDQQIVLFHQYEDLFTDAQQNGGIQPPIADETLEQPNTLAAPSLEAAQEAMQDWIDQQQTRLQMPEFQERRFVERQEDMEWTDSLDPDALPSDG